MDIVRYFKTIIFFLTPNFGKQLVRFSMKKLGTEVVDWKKALKVGVN